MGLPFSISPIEAAHWMMWNHHSLLSNVIESCSVMFAWHFKLGVNRAQLPVDCILAHDWIDEELCPNVESFMKLIGLYAEDILGILIVSTSVGCSTVAGDEWGKVVFVGVLFWAHEKHVFTEMGKAVTFRRFMKRPCVHHKCSSA